MTAMTFIFLYGTNYDRHVFKLYTKWQCMSSMFFFHRGQPATRQKICLLLLLWRHKPIFR